MNVNLEELLIGNWIQTDDQPDKKIFGVGIEKFHKDKTKDTFAIVEQVAEDVIEIKCKSTWSIKKNILTEVVTSIDKKFGKRHGIKIGLILRAYITHLDKESLVITPLDKKNIRKKVIHFKRYYQQ